MLTIPSGNTYEMVTTDDTFLTPEQEATIRTIVEAPDFDFTCLSLSLLTNYKHRGARTFHWYSKDDALHGIRLDVKGRILHHVIARAGMA
jgi:hypothetical protein